MGCLSVLFNLVWILTGGWLTALGFLIVGVLCYVTIIGIPIGRQAFKMASLTLAPFGKEIVYGGARPRWPPTWSGCCWAAGGRPCATWLRERSTA